MFTSKTNFLTPMAWRRNISFLGHLFKKSPSDSLRYSSGPAVQITLENSFKLYNLDSEPAATVNLNQKMATKLYSEMQAVRRLEITCGSLYQEKIIRGFCHLYAGQEACCVGIKSSIRPQDSIITSYRSHGWTFIMGVSLYEIIAELCQKQTGCNRGKGGSMHTYAQNFYGGNGIVGSQAPLGAGVALAHSYRCDGGVIFTCYGDGAANQGQLHEAFNMACLWQLPIIFVCENNKYGMGTSIERSSCSTDYYTRGDYIPGLWVNGNDVLAVKSAAEFVINHACTCGPIVMELETYRYYGHSMSDPGTSYRSREEVQVMRKTNDPITIFRDLCLKNNILKEEDFKKIDEAVKKEVENAVAQARQDKEPELAELTADVYANNLETSIRNVVRRDLKHKNVGKQLIPAGEVKATPKSDIKEVIKAEAVEKTSTKDNVKKDNLPDQKVQKDAKERKVRDNQQMDKTRGKTDATKDKSDKTKDPKKEK